MYYFINKSYIFFSYYKKNTQKEIFCHKNARHLLKFTKKSKLIVMIKKAGIEIMNYLAENSNRKMMTTARNKYFFYALVVIFIILFYFIAHLNAAKIFKCI